MPDRIGSLKDKIILASLKDKLQKPSNLQNAWKELNKSNRSSHGLSFETIEQFGKNLPHNLKIIRKNLRADAYKFSDARGHVITKKKPSGPSKPRGIKIPEVRDRVVQRAIARVIEPVLTKAYNLDNEASFAYLKKCSMRNALIRMILLYKGRRPVIFEADIEKFFDSIDRDLLKKMIFPILPDSSINNLIEEALSIEIGNRDELSQVDWGLFPDADQGIPQGGGLSPLFANVYLHEFDKEMLAKGFGLIRYADDFIVMCKDEKEAKLAHELSLEILEKKLKLKIHKLTADGTGKTRIVRVSQDHFQFLGVRFNGKRLWPSPEKVQTVKQSIREICEFRDDKNLLKILQKIKHTTEGWIAAYSYTDVGNALGELEDELRDRLGHSAYKMGWIPRKTLSAQQRHFSGIPSLLTFLEGQR